MYFSKNNIIKKTNQKKIGRISWYSKKINIEFFFFFFEHGEYGKSDKN